MPRRFSTLAIAVFGAALAVGAKHGAAQWVRPLNDGGGFATPAAVASAVGSVSINLGCSQGLARVTLAKPGDGYQQRGVLSSILRDTVVKYWPVCKEPPHRVEIYEPRYDGDAPTLAVETGAFEPFVGTYHQIIDVRKQEKEREAARDAARQASLLEQRRLEEERQRREAEQRRLAAEAAANAIWWEDFWKTSKMVGPILLALSIIGFLLWHWQTFARWYYFYFYPHPARGMVERALNTRTVLDGPALAAAIGEVSGGNSIFKKVRLEQGETLIARMQAMSRSLQAELARTAAAQARATAREYERKMAEGYEEAALHAIQEAIALAAVALERAKTAWQTSEAIRRRGTA